jgi:lipoate-protein ligase A
MNVPATLPPLGGHCRIVIDMVPSSGSWNMAVDATLLDSAVHNDACTLRFYQWQEPTLSLGYFQSVNDVPSELPLSQLPLVRRLSGGGAIVHHHELTYSCAIPASHPLAREPFSIYLQVHAAIIGVLGELGLSAEFRGAIHSERSAEFQCFSRGDSFDVVIGTDKVLGSAQRRRKGAVLQHGSLILARSAFSPQFIGLSELAGREISAAELLSVLPEVIGSRLGAACRGETLTAAELASAGSLSAGNSESPAWQRGSEKIKPGGHG